MLFVARLEVIEIKYHPVLCSLHVLPVFACFLSGFPSFRPRCKNMRVKREGKSKLAMSVSADGCLLTLSAGELVIENGSIDLGLVLI